MLLVVAAAAPRLLGALRRPAAAESMASAAIDWLSTLDADQKSKAVRPFASPSRTDWHFVPKNDRKGLQLRDMNDRQEEAALALVRSSLSQAGYDKSITIMKLDEILRRLEGDKAKNIRDPKRYFLTIFGTPAVEGSWGLSVEGHHLSLNFTVRDGVLVDSTPQFMGANPAEVKTTFDGLPAAGDRVLRDEEVLALELLSSLDEPQRAKAVIAKEPPKEIREAGAAQPPEEPPAGIPFRELSAKQQSLLRRLVETYCAAMPDEVAADRLRLIESAGGSVAGRGESVHSESVHHGWDDVHFAWAGSLVPGVGHGYRVEGPTFSIEFVNVQPDAEGNPANHIHCVWRDRTGDFDLPVR
jgi:hypothetical protein